MEGVVILPVSSGGTALSGRGVWYPFIPANCGSGKPCRVIKQIDNIVSV